MIDKYFKNHDDLEIEYNNNSISICKNCKSNDIRYNGNYYICIICGLVKIERIKYQVPCFVNNVSFQCRYKRIKYFKKILRSISGLMVCPVSNNVINIVSKYKFNTIFELKKILKNLGLKKYYLSSYYIYKIIKNKNLINLDSNIIKKMVRMFQQIDSCFIELREEYDKERQNYFQYHYIIRKLFRILNRNEFLKYLSLMKSKDKLQWSENFFKIICEKLNFKFICEKL